MTEWTDEALPATDPEPTPLFVEETPGGGQIRLYDYSGDQVADTLLEGFRDGSVVAVVDTNGDLLADTFGLDLNADGLPELLVTRDGDSYRVQPDTNGDGVPDAEMVFTRDELLAIDPTIVEALDLSFADPGTQDPGVQDPGQFDVTTEPAGPLVVDGQLVGDPSGDSEHWFKQAQNGYCVPASIAQIVSEYTGVHYADEMAFVERANELQILDIGPDGVPSMSSDGALALLEDAGIPASLEVGTGVETLIQYLEEGRRVLLFIDSGELWTGEATEDNTPDHAVVVTGVDLERQVVIVSDPGHPAGDAAEYPIALFENAWADAGFLSLVCDVTPEEMPAPSAAPEDMLVAGQPAAVGAEAPLTESPLPGGLLTGDLGGESEGSAAVSYMVEHRWAVLPIVMGAAYLVGRGPRTAR